MLSCPCLLSRSSASRAQHAFSLQARQAASMRSADAGLHSQQRESSSSGNAVGGQRPHLSHAMEKPSSYVKPQMQLIDSVLAGGVSGWDV